MNLWSSGSLSWANQGPLECRIGIHRLDFQRIYGSLLSIILSVVHEFTIQSISPLDRMTATPCGTSCSLPCWQDPGRGSVKHLGFDTSTVATTATLRAAAAVVRAQDLARLVAAAPVG